MQQDLLRARWKKATASQGYGNCVEAASLGSSIAVRDSKDPNGPALVFGAGDWTGFLTGTKKGRFALR